MKELTREEFEDEAAHMCPLTQKWGSGTGCPRCGTAYCTAGLVCRTVKQIRDWLDESGTEAVVLFRNQQMDSSAYGRQSCMVVGQDHTYGLAAECEGRWIGDTPSVRQHAVYYVRAR